jgi:sensor domain CHASE-containing protein
MITLTSVEKLLLTILLSTYKDNIKAVMKERTQQKMKNEDIIERTKIDTIMNHGITLCDNLIEKIKNDIIEKK